MTSAKDYADATEKPVNGMRVWDIDYVQSDCPHCGWDDNRTKADELSHDEMWEWFPFEQECEMCGKTYEVMVDDDDRQPNDRAAALPGLRVEVRVNGARDRWYYPACLNPKCGCDWTDRYPTEAEAAEAWNTRADERYVERSECVMRRDAYGIWVCEACENGADKITGSDGRLDSWTDSWAPNFCPNCGAKVVGE